jgi:hypothetical protein
LLGVHLLRDFTKSGDASRLCALGHGIETGFNL